MKFVPLDIPGAWRIDIEPRADERGFFARTFCADEMAAHGLVTNFPQRSVSFNRKRATLRGLHFQAEPHSETKIVRCTAGACFDVVVDLRPGSARYRQWHGEELSAGNRRMLYIPPGCAHGFQTLADDTEIYYEITPAYVPSAARGVRWNDPGLAITWPILDPIMSERDATLPEVTLDALS